MDNNIDKDKLKLLMNNIRGKIEIYDKVNYKHIDIVIYLYMMLKDSVDEIELKQGWIIDITDNFKIKPYLYIEVYICNKKLYIDLVGGSLNMDPSVHTRLQPWIYKRKPSKKIVNKVKFRY